MMTVINWITSFYDISLVILAGILCAFSSWVTSQLYRHARNRSHRHAISWFLLTALTAALWIGCTHFVAMLGFRPNVPVSFDLGVIFDRSRGQRCWHPVFNHHCCPLCPSHWQRN